jgi:hypothetical protein
MTKQSNKLKRIIVTGSGGTPSTNFVRSLREAPESYYLIGVDSNPYYLQRSETDESYLVPEASDPDYITILRDVAVQTDAEFIHAQPDVEILPISLHRESLGVRTYLPDHNTIEILQDKYQSFLKWHTAGLTVPETMLIKNEEDLKIAFEKFGTPVWIRAIISPGAGKGSFRAENIGVARAWLNFWEGWGNFTAAECLQPDSITWMSLWHKGELIVAQGRKRLYWEFANRAPSGVTGITGTGITVSDTNLDSIALAAIKAVDPSPHGIFSVDLTYDKRGVPNPTEINIGRFFTTHLFFTRAGLNMPHLYTQLAFDGEVPSLPLKINPLPEDLAWIRGMDFLPVLTHVDRVDEAVQELRRRREKLGV